MSNGENKRRAPYKWTAAEEKQVLKMYDEGIGVTAIARELNIPKNSVIGKINQRFRMRCYDGYMPIVSQLAKLYTMREIAEKLKISISSLERMDKKYHMHIARERYDLPKVMAMPHKVTWRAFSTLGGAIAQAEVESMAVIEVHLYNKNIVYAGRRATMVEFLVLNDKDERFKLLKQRPTDIYLKTRDGGRFLISDDELMKYTNIINNNITVIFNDDERE